jgi:hypothetical protein
MDCVDFGNLRQRLKTNSLAEKLSNRHLDILLAHHANGAPLPAAASNSK